ncbi:MAG: PEP-CTERM sorting domain-containing protein [Acidobacteria bacterium]|nr:PEP-CTERM sorting domain-containing protein [Acidobacteriota bacterium]
MNIFRQCVFVSAVASGLNGGVLSSNFGPGDSFNSSLAFEVGNGGVTDWRIAVSFKPSETAYLGSIRFAADHRLFDNDYIVYIANDFGGNPGASIEAIYSVSFPPRPGIVTVKSATNPLLDATLTYWLVVLADAAHSYGFWYANNIGQNGVTYQNAAQSLTWEHGSFSTPVFEITGVPEPSTISLLAAGLGLTAYMRRRGRGRPGRS